MALNMEDFLQRITAIGTCEDETQRRSLLADLSTEAEAIYTEHESSVTERDSLKADNEKLRKANMELFLKIGDHKAPDDPPAEPAKKRSFSDLFDEKGGLK